MYRLHGFCQSGNTYKVAFLLRALGQSWEPMFVDFMNGVTRNPQWRLDLNEMGEAPVLDDGDRRLTQSCWLRARIDNACGIVDTHLAASRFIVGEQPTIADISLCGYMFYPKEESGYELGRFSHICAWLERLRVVPG
jgi:glutathione S-transferase